MNTEKMDTDNLVIEVYSPKWQYAARIVFPLFVILYFLSIPVDCILFSKLFNMFICLLVIFLHILLKKKVLEHGLNENFDNYGSYLDILATTFGWLVDPYDPSPLYYFVLISFIGNNIQRGMSKIRPVHSLTAFLIPSVYMLRICIFGFNLSSFFMLLFSLLLVLYLFLLILKIEELKTQSKKWSKDLELMNSRLMTEIDERKKVEKSLRNSEDQLIKYKEELEIRVQERTNALEFSNTQLKESEKKFRRLFKNVSDYVYLVDIKGNILETNAGLKKDIALDLDEDALKKLNLMDFIDPKYQTAFNDDLKMIIETGQSSGIITTRLRDNRKMTFEYKNILITDHQNKPVAIQGTARDVTKRVEAELQLKLMHQRLLDIIEFLPDALFVIDKNKSIIIWNKALEDMTGYKQEEMVGKANYEYAIPFYSQRRPLVCDFIFDRYPEYESTYLFMEKNEKAIYAEVFVPSLYSGKGAYVWAKASALYDKDGNLTGAIQSIRDISKRKKAEKEARERLDQLYHADRMAILGTLIAGVAHEINNPITSIMLNAPVLKELWGFILPTLDTCYSQKDICNASGMSYAMIRERVPMLLESISDGAERVSNIVSELKDFSREQPPEMIDMVDMNEVVAAAAGLVQNLIKKSTHHFETNLFDNPPKFKGNKQRIEQVVINLIVNSCQALPDKLKKIMISTGFDNHTGKVYLEVCDEGTGIDPEFIQRIKDPFFTTKRNSGGCGLGLAISDKIIQSHNGILSFNSESGTGTIARLEIPVRNT
jgi:PAS domain S-box-containing protein